MNSEKLQKNIELFYRQGFDYRQDGLAWFQEVDELLNGNDETGIYEQMSRVYNERNLRTGLRGRSVSKPKDLIQRYKRKMTNNLARFQASFGHSLVTAAKASRAGIPEQYVHNIAGDTQAGDYATEVINDIITNDRTLKKFPRFAGEIFKYNSAVLVVDEYGIKGDVFKFKTKIYSGKHVLYDPLSDEQDIQTSRFIGMDGFNYSRDILERMKVDSFREKKGYVEEGIDELLKKTAGEESEHETKIPMVQMYIYDEEEEKVHHVIFDEVDKIVVKHTEEPTVSASGREVRFNVVGGIRNIEPGMGHYSKSDFYRQIPILKGQVTMIVDILSVVSQVRANVTVVHPNAYRDVLKAFVDGFPIAMSSASQGGAVQNQMTTLDQPNMVGLQNVYNQFENIFSRLYPENTPELRGSVEEKLKSVYEGNVSVIRKIIEAGSPLENGLKDLFFVIIRILIQNPSHEFLVRSTSIGSFPLDKILSSKLLKPTGDKMSSVAVDIRSVTGDQTDYIQKKEFVGQMLSLAQAGGINLRSFSKWMAMNATKAMVRLTPDDLYIMYSPYDDTVVRQVLNDIKMSAVGEEVIYPSNIVNSDYMQTLSECVKAKAYSYINSKGKFTKEGERVKRFMDRMLALFAQSKQENSEQFQEGELNAAEAEERARNVPEQGAGVSDPGKSAFINQQGHLYGQGQSIAQSA